MCCCDEGRGACAVHADPWHSDPFYMDPSEREQEARDAQMGVPDFKRDGVELK